MAACDTFRGAPGPTRSASCVTSSWRRIGIPTIIQPCLCGSWVGRNPDVYACGFCHRADGRGGPENANLAGLPAAYIVQQMADFKNGARGTSLASRLPPQAMIAVSRAVSAAEIDAAAAYFSAVKLQSQSRNGRGGEVVRPLHAALPGPALSGSSRFRRTWSASSAAIRVRCAYPRQRRTSRSQRRKRPRGLAASRHSPVGRRRTSSASCTISSMCAGSGSLLMPSTARTRGHDLDCCVRCFFAAMIRRAARKLGPSWPSPGNPHRYPEREPRLRSVRSTSSRSPDNQDYRHHEELGRYQGWLPTPDEQASAFLAEMSVAPFPHPGHWVQIGIAEPESQRLIGGIGCLDLDATSDGIGFTVARVAQGSRAGHGRSRGDPGRTDLSPAVPRPSSVIGISRMRTIVQAAAAHAARRHRTARDRDISSAC